MTKSAAVVPVSALEHLIEKAKKEAERHPDGHKAKVQAAIVEKHGEHLSGVHKKKMADAVEKHVAEHRKREGVGQRAREMGRNIVLAHPDGIGPTEIARKIQAKHKDWADGTIRGAVWKLDKDFPREIKKCSNGFCPRRTSNAPGYLTQRKGESDHDYYSRIADAGVR